MDMETEWAASEWVRATSWDSKASAVIGAAGGASCQDWVFGQGDVGTVVMVWMVDEWTYCWGGNGVGTATGMNSELDDNTENGKSPEFLDPDQIGFH